MGGRYYPRHLEHGSRDASTNGRWSSFAFLIYGGSAYVLAISDQTDVGLSSALPLALASSLLPMLPPSDPPCGKVCPGDAGRGWQRFHVLQRSQDDLGPPYTP